MSQTKIEWCDRVWNPITGCSPISSGCNNCYAKRMAYRLKGRYGYSKDDPFRVTFYPDRLDEPLRWKKPCQIFVCSMADPFHKDVKEEWFIPIMQKIRLYANHHTYLFLTKRPQNIENYLAQWFLPNLNNLWLGVSAEDQKTYDERAFILSRINCSHRFISVEPMLGPIVPELLDWKCEWVICGGETGPKARPLHLDWVRSLRDRCQAARVPFFFKGWGEWAWSESPEMKQYKRFEPFKLHRFEDGICMYKVGKKKAGRLLDGREWNESPIVIN